MMHQYDSTEGIVSIDFSTRFPYKFWISSWSKDERYPAGFRYKLLSVRPEPEALIELVVVLEQASGAKTEMSRLNVSPSAFDRTATTFTNGLGDEYGIEFTELDLRDVRSVAEFVKVAKAAGWNATDVH